MQSRQQSQMLPSEQLSHVKALLGKYDELVEQLAASYSVETLAPRVHVISPQAARAGVLFGKDVSITISALIHGVEVAGLAVLVKLLELVTRGEVRLSEPVGFALGNIGAALAAVRFVERDLNRSFGRDSTETSEDQRADELERLFIRSQYLLDFHQVKLPIDRPFWIFPFTRKGYEFARSVGPDVTLVTHWGKGFSQDGRCSDEWVNSCGGVGVTIELGQNGFDAHQIDLGVAIARRAVEAVFSDTMSPSAQASAVTLAPIYTWGEIIPYPNTGERVLDLGWHNFRKVQAGERLGVFAGHEIRASITGPVLFPKYPDPLPDGTFGTVPPAAELIRIMREIDEAELPKS